MKRYLVVLSLLVLICPEVEAQKRPLKARPVQNANNDLDVNYLQPWRDVLLHSERGPEYQTRLNVHWPKGEGPFPCLIFVHGGGYGGGHRDIENAGTGAGAKLIDMAVANGFVAVNINYILGNEIFPQVFYDFRAAVRFLRKHADKYKIDPSRMSAWGHSAGGWLISSCNFPDASQFMLTHGNSTPNDWLPLTPDVVRTLKPNDSRDDPVRFVLNRKSFLVPMEDPRPLYGEYSSRLQALVYDFSHNTSSASSDDPATLVFVGAGVEPKDKVMEKGGVRVFSAVALEPKLKGQSVVHVPNYFGASIGADGKTPMMLCERVIEFLKHELIADPRTPAPEFRPNRRVFDKQIQIEMVVPAKDIELNYTLDGSEPNSTSPRYTEPFAIDKTTVVKAIATRKGWRPSGVASALFFQGALPPTIAGPDALPVGKVGQTYTATFLAKDAKTVTWSVAFNVPPQAPAFGERKKMLDVKELREKGYGLLLGLTLDASKGVLSDTPTVAGNYVLQVQAGWGYGHLADTRTYVLRVEP